MKAIGDGRGPAALVQEIERGEARLQAIGAEVNRLAGGPALADVELKRLERQVEGDLARFTDLLKGDVRTAQQALKQLLVERVRFTSVTLGRGTRTYAFRGQLTYEAVLRNIWVVAPTGLGRAR